MKEKLLNFDPHGPHEPTKNPLYDIDEETLTKPGEAPIEIVDIFRKYTVPIFTDPDPEKRFFLAQDDKEGQLLFAATLDLAIKLLKKLNLLDYNGKLKNQRMRIFTVEKDGLFEQYINHATN